MTEMLTDLQILPRGVYLQLLVEMKLLDDAIIRSNEPEEVLTQKYEQLGDRFIIPWRKTKGRLRRLVMEKQRSLAISVNCHLKDNLCMKCPACLLFGGTGEVSTNKVPYNLLSRVMGDTFISVRKVEDISTCTANAIDEKTLTTGQALMSLVKVPVETVFRGVVTLRDPTLHLALILIDGLERVSRIGGSTREWGRVRTTVEGYVLVDREIWSSYECANQKPTSNPVSSLNLNGSLEDAYKKVSEEFTALLGRENLGEQTQAGRGKASKTSRKAAPLPDATEAQN
ncbi:MAG: type I-D CRISPR-associated protein Cas7/Csc2 [Thermodesulfobacteriota bacterium]